MVDVASFVEEEEEARTFSGDVFRVIVLAVRVFRGSISNGLVTMLVTIR